MDETTYEDEQGLSNSSEMRGTGRREFIAALEEKMSYPTSSIDIDRDIGNFFYDLKPARDAGVGLTEQTIHYIADVKGEPEWIRAFRKNAYRVFKSKPLPAHWAGDELKAIHFGLIRYCLASGEATKRSWEDVPKEIKETFERLGIPSSLEQGLNYFLDAAFFPEPPKNQVRPDPTHGDSFSLSGRMRIDNGEVFTMTQFRTH